MSTFSALLKCRLGSAAAEMALVLPFLVVLLFGSVEIGHYFYNEHQVVKGVRDGARFASRQSFEAFNCDEGSLGEDDIPPGLAIPIKEITRTGEIAGGTARVVGWSNDDIIVTMTCPAKPVKTGIYKDESNAPQINIVATVEYESLFGGIGVLGSTYLRASQQAAVMGI